MAAGEGGKQRGAGPLAQQSIAIGSYDAPWRGRSHTKCCYERLGDGEEDASPVARIIHQEKSWELTDVVVACMLTSFSLVSILGLRYPLQMLPVLLWELVWKSIWLLVVALPLWTGGQMDEATWETASACLLVVIFPFVIPGRYVFAHYVKKRGDRWR